MLNLTFRPITVPWTNACFNNKFQNPMLKIYQYLTALGVVVAWVGMGFIRTAVFIGVSSAYSSKFFCWIGGPCGCADALLMTMMKATRYGNRRCIIIGLRVFFLFIKSSAVLGWTDIAEDPKFEERNNRRKKQNDEFLGNVGMEISPTRMKLPM